MRLFPVKHLLTGCVFGSLVAFSICSNDLSDRIENMLIKFAGNNKLGRAASMLEDTIRIPNDLYKLEKLKGSMSIRRNVDRCLKIGVIIYINTE